MCSWCSVDLDHYLSVFLFFFSNDTATTEIYTLSLHDALPICHLHRRHRRRRRSRFQPQRATVARSQRDRKSTRLNSSHDQISYAVFCLKKKKKKKIILIYIKKKNNK